MCSSGMARPARDDRATDRGASVVAHLAEVDTTPGVVSMALEDTLDTCTEARDLFTVHLRTDFRPTGAPSPEATQPCGVTCTAPDLGAEVADPTAPGLQDDAPLLPWSRTLQHQDSRTT